MCWRAFWMVFCVSEKTECVRDLFGEIGFVGGVRLKRLMVMMRKGVTMLLDDGGFVTFLC